MTTVCSGTIPASDMLDYAGLAVVFAIMTIGIPHTVSSLVGGSIGLALAHAFEAAYIAQTIVRPITSGLKKIHDGISRFRKRKQRHEGPAMVCRVPCKTYETASAKSSADAGASCRDQSAQSVQRSTAWLQLPSPRWLKSPRPAASTATE